MATTLADLVNRTRLYLHDWPDQDALTASVTSGGTSLSVADTTIYFKNETIEVDSEAMIVRALASATSLTVKRGAFGSTAASHASAAPILIRPRFRQVQITQALNDGIDACFPLLYKPVLDTSLTGLADTYEYTIPSTISYLSKVETKESGDFAYRELRSWEIRRASTPKLKFRRVPSLGCTIRLHGYGPFGHLTALTDAVDGLWPANADPLPVEYAVAELLMSGEALRVRTDVGAIDSREQATRVGASSSLASMMLSRFYTLRREVAMPPLPRNVVSVL